MTPQAYADRVLDLVRQKALHADEVDRTAARTTVSAAAARAGDPAELHAALRAVVVAAGGPHSGLVSPGRPSREAEEPAVLPSACAGDPRSAVRYARAGGRALRELADAGAWVVDLRGNTGGSMWPMLAVAAPLLGGDWVIGAFVDRDGYRIPWWVRRRTVGAGRGRARARSRGPLRLRGPVAVPTDGGRPRRALRALTGGLPGRTSAVRPGKPPEVSPWGTPRRSPAGS